MFLQIQIYKTKKQIIYLYPKKAWTEHLLNSTGVYLDISTNFCRIYFGERLFCQIVQFPWYLVHLSPGPKNQNLWKMKKTPQVFIHPRKKCAKFQPNHIIFNIHTYKQTDIIRFYLKWSWENKKSFQKWYFKKIFFYLLQFFKQLLLLWDKHRKVFQSVNIFKTNYLVKKVL